MTTYALVIEQSSASTRETKLYSSAVNALDELDWWRSDGAAIIAILRDGQAFDETGLRADEAALRRVVQAVAGLP